MPTPTYDLISEQVLGSTAASVTFSSIPGTYKDLVLEIVPIAATSASNVWGTVNGDTGSNYSETYLSGNGSTTESGRVSNSSRIGPGYAALTFSGATYTHFFSYSNTNVNKMIISRNSPSTVYSGASVNLWRSTAAITSINIFLQNGTNFGINSTFRLWGVAG